MHPNMIRFCHQIKNNKNCLERRFFQADSLKELVMFFCPLVVRISIVLQASFLSNSVGRLPLVRCPDSTAKCPSEVRMGGINVNEPTSVEEAALLPEGLGEASRDDENNKGSPDTK